MLIGCYVALSQARHETIGLLITDIGHLPDGERHAIRRAQRDFVREWVHLLRLDQPRLDATAARIRVHAALSVADDIARPPTCAAIRPSRPPSRSSAPASSACPSPTLTGPARRRPGRGRR